MELFQELLFTISLSLIVSLLMVKLFSLASGFEDGNSMVSKRVVEEKMMEKEWVVCESEKEEKVGYFDDAVEVSEEVGYGGYDEGELGSGCVIEGLKSVGGVGARHVFDESPERKDGVVGLVVEDLKSVGEVGAGHVFDEIPQRKDDVFSLVESGEVGARYVFDESPQRKDDVFSLVESGEANVSGSLMEMEEDCVELLPESAAVDGGGGGGGEVKVEEGDGGLYDDWQGIETTELEKRFGAGVAFMGSKIGADRLSLIDNEVKLELYGLHKVALEGACFESQPMALKISARANWNAWKRLENLGREEAMAQYIALLSQHVPDWMGNHACEDYMQDFVATETPEKLHSDEEIPTRAESER